MFVGAFLHEPRRILRACLRVSAVAELPAMRPQPIARARAGRADRCFGASASPTPSCSTALRAPASATRRACLTVFSRSLRRFACQRRHACRSSVHQHGAVGDSSTAVSLLPLDPGFDFRRIAQRVAFERHGLHLGFEQPRRALDGLHRPGRLWRRSRPGRPRAACGRGGPRALRRSPCPAWTAPSARQRS